MVAGDEFELDAGQPAPRPGSASAFCRCGGAGRIELLLEARSDSPPRPAAAWPAAGSYLKAVEISSGAPGMPLGMMDCQREAIEAHRRLGQRLPVQHVLESLGGLAASAGRVLHVQGDVVEAEARHVLDRPSSFFGQRRPGRRVATYWPTSTSPASICSRRLPDSGMWRMITRRMAGLPPNSPRRASAIRMSFGRHCASLKAPLGGDVALQPVAGEVAALLHARARPCGR